MANLQNKPDFFGTFADRTTISGSSLPNDQRISYSLRRSKGRRRISLTIDERGLSVSAPLRAPIGEIEAILREHARWIVRKLAEWQVRRMPARRWESGETLMLLGEKLQLVVAAGAEHVESDHTVLLVSTPQSQPGKVASIVRAWLHTQALNDFTARVERYRAIMGVQPVAVRLSNARTRWGSCHAHGRILLNWRLIQMPERLIDYVVVHELAHLREMNHSPRFWAIVAHTIPDYAARRKEIRREAHHYITE